MIVGGVGTLLGVVVICVCGLISLAGQSVGIFPTTVPTTAQVLLAAAPTTVEVEPTATLLPSPTPLPAVAPSVTSAPTVAPSATPLLPSPVPPTAKPTVAQAIVVAPTTKPQPTARPKPTAAPAPTTAPVPTAPPSNGEPVFANKEVSPAYWPCQPDQIKGNKNSKIYHVPSGQFYAKTYENVVCFNTEGEAQSAGYKPSKR
ncbi:MAG: hypothetical protein IPO81_09365 [Kouleothrix sp.]|nr:hypothetical protein [Kouleothrix sp.]